MKTENELIAEFMGYKYYPFTVEERAMAFGWIKEGANRKMPEKMLMSQRDIYLCRPKNGLRYHTSWDWFMPAYKKFKDCLYDIHKTMPPHSACKGDLDDVDIHCAIIEVDLKAAHAFLAKGIKWYYSQK